MLQHSWGGKTLPILAIVYNGTPIQWTFQSSDRIKPSYFWMPVGKVMREVESGLIRRRKRGDRLRVVISFENLFNAQFVEFMRRFIEVGEGIFYPHPDQLINPEYSDYYWQVICESDFDFKFFQDRFLGHLGEIVLLGKYTDKNLPVDNSGNIGGF